MGAKQTRVATFETAAEILPENEREKETQASIYLTPALINQINGVQGAPTKLKEAWGEMNAEQQAVIKKQLQMAYAKGVDDCRKKVEVELKQNPQQTATSAPSLVQQAQLAKEQEERENKRVQQLVAEINKKKYCAPLRDVKCSPEHEACLQCYKDKGSDVLECKEVADAFVRCARQYTEKFLDES